MHGDRRRRRGDGTARQDLRRGGATRASIASAPQHDSSRKSSSRSWTSEDSRTYRSSRCSSSPASVSSSRNGGEESARNELPPNEYWPLQGGAGSRVAFLKAFIERNQEWLHLYDYKLLGLNAQQALAYLTDMGEFESTKRHLLDRQADFERGNGSLSMTSTLGKDRGMQHNHPSEEYQRFHKARVARGGVSARPSPCDTDPFLRAFESAPCRSSSLPSFSSPQTPLRSRQVGSARQGRSDGHDVFSAARSIQRDSSSTNLEKKGERQRQWITPAEKYLAFADKKSFNMRRGWEPDYGGFSRYVAFQQGMKNLALPR